MANGITEKDYRNLAKCLNVGDPELIGKMLSIILDSENRPVPVRSLVEKLGVSYPTVSRIINEMEVMGLVISEKERGQQRRPGRPKKVVRLNMDELKARARECIESLQKFIK